MDCSCNLILNVREVSLNFFLFVYMMLQSPVQQKNVQGLCIFILTTFKRNVSVIQVVFPFFFFYIVTVKSSFCSNAAFITVGFFTVFRYVIVTLMFCTDQFVN